MTGQIVASAIGVMLAGAFALWFVVPAVRREPDRSGWLLLASIASIILMSSIRALATRYPDAFGTLQAAHRLSNELLLLGALLMFEFGNTFAGPRRMLAWSVRIAAIAVAVAGALVTNNVAGTPRTPSQDVLAYCLLAIWTIGIGSAALRIWLIHQASTSPIIRGRLGLLAISLAVLAGALWFAVLWPTTAGVILTRSFVVLSLMSVAIAFGPPAALRATWQSRSIRTAQKATVAVVDAEDEATAVNSILPVLATLLGSTRIEAWDGDGRLRYEYDADVVTAHRGSWKSHDLSIPLPTVGGEVRSIGSPYAPLLGAGDDLSAKVLVTTLDLALDRIHRLQRERRRAARIEESDRMKDTFLAAVSHDLRNPLTAMIGFAHILQEPADVPPLDAPTRTLAATELLVASEQLDRMLDGLLDLSRIQHGRMALDRVPCDVLAVVRAGAERAILESGSVHVLGDSVTAPLDRAKVEKIVEYLVINADRHSPTGSVVEVIVVADPESDAVAIHVDDDGPGISLDERIDLFQALAAGGSARSGSGTGIGLALVTRFTELHGGRIQIDDSPLGGARFTVVLPMSRLAAISHLGTATIAAESQIGPGHA